MKNLKLIGCLMLMISSLMFIQCTSDVIVGPQGEAGIDGIDGIDGINGVDGVDGTATCVACHSENHRTPIEDSYTLSTHANSNMMYTGETVYQYAGKRGLDAGGCAQCHSNEGFIDYITKGSVAATEYPNPTAISCTTCHDKHSTFDFENDGYDYALRTFEPVTLIVDDTKTIDFGDKSNTCAQCHQPRTATPTSTDGMFTITSTHWGPHHGPQTTLLEGIQGANFVGSITYPTPGSASHRQNSSCVKCHMGETTDGSDGAHTWNPTENACATCHSTTPTGITGFDDDMNTLAALLEAVTGTDATTGDPVVGIVHEGSPQKGIFTITEAKAAWNYLFILEDKSNGIHNPKYSKALIKNTIETLQE